MLLISGEFKINGFFGGFFYIKNWYININIFNDMDVRLDFFGICFGFVYKYMILNWCLLF